MVVREQTSSLPYEFPALAWRSSQPLLPKSTISHSRKFVHPYAIPDQKLHSGEVDRNCSVFGLEASELSLSIASFALTVFISGQSRSSCCKRAISLPASCNEHVAWMHTALPLLKAHPPPSSSVPSYPSTILPH
jgi:hypothetical protein